MPHDQMLLTVLGFVIFANALLLGLIPLANWRQRRSSRQGGASAGATARESSRPVVAASGRANVRDEADARAAAAIEAFVDEVSTGAPANRASEPPSLASMPDLEPPFDDPDGIPRGAAGPAAWDRTIREASDRHPRSGRSVTVVLAELPHLDGIAGMLGRDAADRVVSEVSRLLASEDGAGDRVAWLGNGRFGVLLFEAGEIGSRNYVDRVRAAADGWLESAGLSIRLSLGWASAADGTDVVAAMAAAEQRMLAGDRRSLKGHA